ncbi:hypothetical protein B0H13DRAFT_1866505 [Mycena leptocephala]|nr:hypothetical protein B0H13DRAFT_1866505 [Mycena leptocephala]
MRACGACGDKSFSQYCGLADSQDARWSWLRNIYIDRSTNDGATGVNIRWPSSISGSVHAIHTSSDVQFVLGLERVFDGRGVQLYGIQAPEVFGHHSLPVPLMVSWGRGNTVYMLPKTAHEYPLYNRNFHLVEVRDQSLDTHCSRNAQPACWLIWKLGDMLWVVFMMLWAHGKPSSERKTILGSPLEKPEI